MAGRPRIRGVEAVADDAALAAASCADPLRELGASNLLAQAARLAHGEQGAWVYAVYDRLNAACWNGRLPQAVVNFGLTPRGCCMGLTGGNNPAPAILLHPGMENPGAWNQGECAGWRNVALVLLHECVHVAIRYLYAGLPNPGESSHNSDLWCRETNRISRLIDLPEACARVTPQRTGGRLVRAPITPTLAGVSMRSVSTWPHGIAQVVYGAGGIQSWQQRACDALGVMAPQKESAAKPRVPSMRS